MESEKEVPDREKINNDIVKTNELDKSLKENFFMLHKSEWVHLDFGNLSRKLTIEGENPDLIEDHSIFYWLGMRNSTISLLAKG